MSIGDYRLQARLGVGADGAAYVGVDGRGRAVVVHHLRPVAADDERRRELLARRGLLGLLPGGVRAVWEDGLRDDVPYLVVEGGRRTLARALRRGQLDDDGALRVLARVARTLAAAHSLDVYHGALCPTAVLLDGDDLPSIDLLGLCTGAPTRRHVVDEGCVPPEGEAATRAADAWALGGLVRAMVDAGLELPEHVRALGEELLAPEPEARPPVDPIAKELGRVAGGDARASATVVFSQAGETTPGRNLRSTPGHEEPPPVEQVGRFRLERLLGRGANGVVCEGKDLTDGTRVAVKLLEGTRLDDRGRQRFRKEARVLAQVSHPQLARLIAADCDHEPPYLVVELCEGQSLGALLRDRKEAWSPVYAGRIALEAARGLLAVHDVGVVHRDVKPDNIMVGGSDEAPSVKVIDFGLARPVEQETESLEITRDGAILGTPLYMAPEQATGDGLDARADVYALGATLFTMLVGEPPFPGKKAAAVLARLLREDAPRVRDRRPDCPVAIAEITDRALSKNPDDRFADAGELVRALERALGMEPELLPAHPHVPQGEEDRILTYRFEWQLPGTPRALWPYVSNTERLNRAIGLGAVDYETRTDEGEVRRFGEVQVAGLNLRWREHPYEWVEGRRLGILREFTRGPFLWMKSAVDLLPADDDGHTCLVHEIQVEPRGVMGRAAAAIEVGRRAKRGLDRVYRRIGDLVGGRLQGERSRAVDAFELPDRLPAAAEKSLARLEKELRERGVSTRAVAALGDLVRYAPAPEVARIRPLAFASRFDLTDDEALAACLHGADVGMLELLWDILCPACRIPAQLTDTLKALEDHGRCDACDLDFELDLGRSVELVFRTHPGVRQADTGFYCIGGPGHSPHVVAQVRLAPGERFELDLTLDEGEYRLAGRTLPWGLDFRVDERGRVRRWDLRLSEPPPLALARALAPGRQRLVLENDTDTERVARVERRASRSDALTAARAAALPLFRELFPGELLRDGQLVSVSWVSLLRVELRALDDLYDREPAPRVFERLHGVWREIETCAAAEGGTLVKIEGDGALCVLPDVISALRAATSLAPKLVSQHMLAPVVAVHAGAAMMVTLNDRLDYFGPVTRDLRDLTREALGESGIVVSDNVALDFAARALLAGRFLLEPVVRQDGELAHILTVREPDSVASADADGDITAPETPRARPA